MTSQYKRLIAILSGILVIVAVVIAFSVRSAQLNSSSTVSAQLEPTVNTISQEERAAFLTATAFTGNLLRRCADPTPAPSSLSEQGRSTIAAQRGIPLESIAWMDEYDLPNKQDADGKRSIPNFGDEVHIVVLQLQSRPANYSGPGAFILAIDPKQGTIEDLNKDGKGSQYVRDPNTYTTWHCTPEPTPDWTPIPVTPPAVDSEPVIPSPGSR